VCVAFFIGEQYKKLQGTNAVMPKPLVEDESCGVYNCDNEC